MNIFFILFIMVLFLLGFRVKKKGVICCPNAGLGSEVFQSDSDDSENGQKHSKEGCNSRVPTCSISIDNLSHC